MDENPYKAPETEGDGDPPQPRRRTKSAMGYFCAILLGAFLGALLLAGPLALLDDSGGIQLSVGAFLGLVIYQFLF